MADTFERIEDHLAAWIERQPMFFVASAPLAADGRVNVSPKGPIGTFAVLGPNQVAYLDFFGSGAETVAHLRENGRITVMFCAFEGPPRILRLHGQGTVLPADAVAFDTDPPPGTERAVIRVDVERIADSCGYGVPVMEYVGTRPQYPAWAETKLRKGGEHALEEYMAEENAVSIDGLPAVDLEPA